MPETFGQLLDKLIRRLEYPDPRIRRNAAAAIRLHGPRAEAAIPALDALLEDEDPRVRHEARRALDRLRAPAA